MQVQYKIFQSSVESWTGLFDQASAFASELGPKRLIGISHSEGREGWHANGVITVWFWDKVPEN